jgi:fructose-1-phosphate kinase PfkB-like protein
VKILFVGRILKDHFTNKTRIGGNVLNQASTLAKLIEPTSIHLISSVSPKDQDIFDYINELKINFYNVETSTTPIIKYDKNNKVEEVNLYNLMQDFTKEKVSNFNNIIKEASIIVCDLGNKEIVEHVIKINPKAKLIIEPISLHHVSDLNYNILNRTFLFKGNKDEVSKLTQIEIKNKEDCFKAVDCLKIMGVRRAFITLDKKGSYYFDEHVIGFKESKLVSQKTIVGAGDIFLAGIIYALRITQDMDILADYANRIFLKFYNKL